VLLEKPFYQIYFVPDVSELDPADYPFVYEAWEFGLHGAIAIRLRSRGEHFQFGSVFI
jgi:hypothetical protein